MFECIDPMHLYVVENNQAIQFIKCTEGKLIHPGTTNESLLEVLLHRTGYLDEKFPCVENKLAIQHMQLALNALYDRTAKRVAQGVETKDIPHLS
jgi:hypothetical protein